MVFIDEKIERLFIFIIKLNRHVALTQQDAKKVNFNRLKHSTGNMAIAT